jgi:trehalose synthase
MIERVDTAGETAAPALEDYEAFAHLALAVRELREEASQLVPRIGERRVWMVNSTARGGGVAEMLPGLISGLRQLGVDARWLVASTDREEFFGLTKRLHNLIHGRGEADLGDEERKLYRLVSEELAAELEEVVGPDDLLVVHDPQPMGAGALLRERLRDRVPARTVWRCHIGLDRRTEETRAAWRFLAPYAESYEEAVFSAPEYIPDLFGNRATLIRPSIDPLSDKNRELSPHKLQGVLCNASLARQDAPVLTPPFDRGARRLSPDGEWLPATEPEELGILFRPMVVQISRWDRLKGFEPLLRAFALLKGRTGDADPVHGRRREIVRLALAGPEPEAVSDDPEGQEVLEELRRAYMDLPPPIQRDVAILSLPMASRRENALMVNALQRCATVVVQNSLEEGFGLTVAEAMWKRTAVLGSRACGIRQQIQHHLNGYLVDHPEDPSAVAEALDALLADPVERERLGAAAQRRVYEQFLVFTHIREWLRLMAKLLMR